MAKFKVRFKVEKLEFEMEGERESAPSVNQALQQHFSTLLKPAQVASEAVSASAPAPAPMIETPSHGNGQGRRRLSRGVGRKSGDNEQPFDFRHDPDKWGTPKQSWSVGQKVIWLLYVINQQAGRGDFGGHCIAATFNKNFREAGILHGSNMKRDLGTFKMKSPSAIGEDTSKTPAQWFLTDEGKRQAAGLVQRSLCPSQKTSA